MFRAVRQFLTPRWIALHLLVLAAAVGMVALGRWQLQVSDRRHFDLQNFGYALQWWAFTVCAMLFWGRLIFEARRGEVAADPAGTQLVLAGGLARPVSAIERPGPADLVIPGSGSSEVAPSTFRGYVMPQSSTSPARSEGDVYHAAYNDHLWQLALNDTAETADRSRRDHSGAGRPGRSTAEEHDPTEGTSRRPGGGKIIEASIPVVHEAVESTDPST